MEDKYYKIILDELLKLLGEGVYIVDDLGIGIGYNQSMADMEQINVEDVVGKEYQKAFPGINPEDSTMFRALKKKEAIKNFQQTYLNLYGKEVTTVNSTVPVLSEGKVIAAIEVASDITALKDMAETIQDLRSDIIESMALEKSSSNRGAIRRYGFDDLIGQSSEFLSVVEKAKKASSNTVSVFICGETGTGKELFAQSIHYASDRKDAPFLAQNCAALPETLLEGILFGTSKGGFTGAIDRAGLFEQATDGTLLLDEISAMPYDLQGKLLRVLQEKYIRRVGGTKDIPIDTRIIATVNEDPLKLIQDGKLRKDLYYRLNVVNISIPPLRTHKEDIPLLVKRFLDVNNKRFGKELRMISDGALRLLHGYDYPGNVRELENIIIQSVSMAADEHVLTETLLQMPIRTGDFKEDVEGWNMYEPLPEYLEKVETELIREALLREGGNVTRAAETLGIKRQTLQHKLKKFNW